ncbi:hypothetical protein [Aestuariivirga sp.]|uniref:hypothetical protein n=1 Tax=Aestuariivirga sp. TaxID=2650926 RepID=UPI0039E2981D
MAANEGFFVENAAPLTDGARAAFCVLGMPRGGTTMTAKLLQAAGIFMGQSLPVTAEDPDFAKLLKDKAPDRGEFDALLATRFGAHRRWGFKAPYKNHWDLLDAIPDSRFVVVFRDVLAVANRNRISTSADLLSNMAANLALQTQLARFIAKSGRPVFMFSYEKAVLEPQPIITALQDFCGAGSNAATRAAMMAVIRPNDSEYAEVMDRLASNVSCNLDIVNPHRIAGWARAASGKHLNIRITVNGEAVAEVVADRPRDDLSRHFGDAGDYAFEVPLEAGLYAGKPLSVEVRDAGTGAVLARRAVPA